VGAAEVSALRELAPLQNGGNSVLPDTASLAAVHADMQQKRRVTPVAGMNKRPGRWL
jgi:hypothetical protein